MRGQLYLMDVFNYEMNICLDGCLVFNLKNNKKNIKELLGWEPVSLSVKRSRLCSLHMWNVKMTV